MAVRLKMALCGNIDTINLVLSWHNSEIVRLLGATRRVKLDNHQYRQGRGKGWLFPAHHQPGLTKNFFFSKTQL